MEPGRISPDRVFLDGLCIIRMTVSCGSVHTGFKTGAAAGASLPKDRSQ